MNTVLMLILIALMAMVVVSLVRGIVAFLRSAREDIDRPDALGPSANQAKQNKAMMQRVLFQGAAILVVIVLLMSTR